MTPIVEERQSAETAGLELASPAAADVREFETRTISIDEWHEFAQGHPDRVVFHHRCWIELMMEQYGMPSRFDAVVRGGEIVAAIPFLRTRSLLGKSKYVCLPFTDYVHPLINCDDARDVLQKALRQDSDLNGSGAVLIRTDKPLTNSDNHSNWVRHHLDISGTLDEIRARFNRKVLQNYRRGERGQLAFSISSDAQAMEEFYRLHVTTRKKLGVPVQPRSFFLKLQKRVIEQGLGFVALVHKGTAPVAAGVYLGDNHVLFAKYLASEPAALDLYPNEFLLFQSIQAAVAQGYHVFDFGLTKKAQAGLRRFKQKWGTVESEVYQEHILGGNERFGQDSAMLQVAQVVIRHSPSAVCRLLGEMFYRYSY